MTFRWHWGHSVAAVYTLFAASTIGFVVFAMEQRVDLVSTDYYEQSIALDARRSAEANARALGTGFSITETADGRAVTVQWPAAAVTGASGTLTLYRPSDATADRHTTMAPDAQGTQSVSLAGLAPGRWMLQVKWSVGDRAFYAERAVVAR
ncbi:MAG: FixH family protein [Acidobacteria bacterium]|nr:FixH family protein [Acidobacteriota bacterium]MBP8272862.1 FixH family protein [Acidobacteriota bacterium]